jgi:dolichol-phosphate mannosyltransferase
MGFIGIYIGYIFQEVKRRPVYLIRKILPPRWAEEATHPVHPEVPGG